MSRALDHIEVLQKELLALRPIDKERQQNIDEKFRLDFNYNSNHMEGNTLTYGETMVLLIYGETTGKHNIREYFEMRAHDVAFRLIEDWAKQKELPLTEQDIKNLNRIILVEPFWKDAITWEGQPTRKLITIGNYKEEPNYVRLENGEIFHFTLPAETPIQMAELMQWYRREESNLHPVLLAALLHYRVVRIHPFDDGNGRVARLLMNYVLLRNGYPPVVIRSEDKANYLTSLHHADSNNFEPLVEYVSAQLIRSLKLVIMGAKGENIDEPGDFEKRVRLLKTKLQTDGNLELRLTKSENAVLVAFEAGILPLLHRIEKKLSKLDTLFKATTKQLLIGSTVISNKLPEDIGFIKTSLKSYKLSISQFGFNYFLAELRKDPQLTVSARVVILLHDSVYEVRTDASPTPITKLYDEKFTEPELELISESIGNYVLASIEKYLGKS